MPRIAVMAARRAKLGQTLARPALVCWVARIASSTRRPATTSAATPIPETTSSAATATSSRRPAPGDRQPGADQPQHLPARPALRAGVHLVNGRASPLPPLDRDPPSAYMPPIFSTPPAVPD